MSYCIHLQQASSADLPVSEATIMQWVELTLTGRMAAAELTIRLVDVAEMIELNHTYRKKNKPTNVLAFPSSVPKEIPLEYPLLGDIIICPFVLAEESQAQDTPLIAHWAHIVIHGVLHLLGYDHVQEEDAQVMQTLEIKLLAMLGFANPYKEDETIE